LRDEEDYLVTGPDLRQYSLYSKSWPLDREPYYLGTNVPGVLPRAMSATDLSNGAPRPLAGAQWLSHLCIDT
jgi:thioredoxin reductase (NADPH)